MEPGSVEGIEVAPPLGGQLDAQHLTKALDAFFQPLDDLFLKLGGALGFVESSRQQAAEIHERTGRPVLSVETWQMLGAAPFRLPMRLWLQMPKPPMAKWSLPWTRLSPPA